jgi:hypothetical protein
MKDEEYPNRMGHLLQGAFQQLKIPWRKKNKKVD